MKVLHSFTCVGSDWLFISSLKNKICSNNTNMTVKQDHDETNGSQKDIVQK